MQDETKHSLLANEQQVPTCPTEGNYGYGQQPTSGYSFVPQPTPPSYVAHNPTISQPNTGFPQQQYSSPVPPPSAYGQQNVSSTVVTSQPSTYLFNTATVVTTQPQRQWRYKMSDCCTNCNVCCLVYLFPQCVECGTAKRLNENPCIGCCPGGLALSRAKYRSIHHIEGTLMDDACKSVWCRACVLCQLVNDMNAEGYPKECCGCC